jgi:hypothetical protein
MSDGVRGGGLDGETETIERDHGGPDVIQEYTFETTPLLPGEQPDSGLRDDAEHWIAVYEELTNFLLDALPDVPDALERYRGRLEYWRRRRVETEHPGLSCRESRTQMNRGIR